MLQHNQFPMSSTSKYVELINGKPTTTSMIIAKEFGKRHDHVLRDIRNLEIPDDFRLPNFGDVEIIEENALGGKVIRKYCTVTRNGFMLLAMGFTGKKAMAVKLAFINQFDAMESRLKEIAERPALPAPEPVQSIRLDRVLSVEEYVDLMRFKIQTLENQTRTLERQNRDQQATIEAVATLPARPARKPRNRRAITDTDRQEIIGLYNDGHSVNAICNLVRRHRETVNRVIDQSIETDPSGMLDLSAAIEPGEEARTNGTSWRAA